jgi:hypothetical protein
MSKLPNWDGNTPVTWRLTRNYGEINVNQEDKQESDAGNAKYRSKKRGVYMHIQKVLTIQLLELRKW